MASAHSQGSHNHLRLSIFPISTQKALCLVSALWTFSHISKPTWSDTSLLRKAVIDCVARIYLPSFLTLSQLGLDHILPGIKVTCVYIALPLRHWKLFGVSRNHCPYQPLDQWFAHHVYWIDFFSLLTRSSFYPSRSTSMSFTDVVQLCQGIITDFLSLHH